MTNPKLVAEYLCNREPHPVRARLLNDKAFLTRYDLSPRTVLTVAGVVPIDLYDLIISTRQVLISRAGQQIKDLKDREISLVPQPIGVALRWTQPDKSPADFCFPELLMLSSRPEERITALKKIIDRLGPTGEDFSPLLYFAESRELSDQEASTLLIEAASGVVPRQGRAAIALNADDEVALKEIIPDSFDYFERFCGPNPQNIDPEQYFSQVLPEYRRELLWRNLQQGLDICLLGALRDDLSPYLWTEDVGDDDLWRVLEACDPWHDPFSLIGALDIAVRRQHDERFRGLIEKAITKLTYEQFLRNDGVDVYKLLPLFAQVVLNRLSVMEGGPLRAPYWKRMCAWMQAGLLVRLTPPHKLNCDHFQEWVRTNQVPAEYFAEILDLRREPMFSAEQMSSLSLRNEIIGRLLVLRERHKNAGRLLAGSEILDAAVERLTVNGSPLDWQFPGPLEGYRTPAQSSMRFPEEDLKKILEDLSKKQVSVEWERFAYFSQRFDLGRELLARLREESGNLNLNSKEAVGQVTAACIVAMAHRDTEFGQSIASRIIAKAGEISTENETMMILSLILYAGASFQKEEDWAKWLAERLNDLAARVPAGTPSKTLLTLLRELKTVIPFTYPICSQAEAVVSAAV